MLKVAITAIFTVFVMLVLPTAIATVFVEAPTLF